jgi:DNA-binding transcriptional regulator YdaS (Cro superfamily)
MLRRRLQAEEGMRAEMAARLQVAEDGVNQMAKRQSQPNPAGAIEVETKIGGE